MCDNVHTTCMSFAHAHTDSRGKIKSRAQLGLDACSSIMATNEELTEKVTQLEDMLEVKASSANFDCVEILRIA